MADITCDRIQWKKLWQLTSGFHYETPNAEVENKLMEVSKELLDGILQYKKNVPASNEKLENLMKKGKHENLIHFTKNLQEFLDIDALQSWSILCSYLINEYRGSANSLPNYISDDTNMLKLLQDIWSFYSLERMVVLKILKNMLEFYDFPSHPYANEYNKILQKIGLDNLRQSFLEQLDYLVKEGPPSSSGFGEYSQLPNKLTLLAERKSREINEILHLILLVVHYKGIGPKELKKLLEIFKYHMFGRQQSHLSVGNDLHNDLILKITYSDVALFLSCIDVSGKTDYENWIKETVEELEPYIINMHQNPEHGPILLGWMLLNFRLSNVMLDEEVSTKYRQFGTKAVQLGVFEYLYRLISHPMFKENSLISKIVRKCIYNHLCHLCDLFDADGSVAQHSKIFDLFNEILTTPSIGSEFCKHEEHGIRSLFDTAMEFFPAEFVPLTEIALSLATTGSSQYEYIKKQLDNLVVYTEVYTGKQLELRSSPDKEDEFILIQDYKPFPRIDYTIPRGTQVVIIDKKNFTLVHFKTSLNYFQALHHEINEMLADTLRSTEVDKTRLQRVVSGIKYLAKAVNRIKSPQEISSTMVHPTEMVFDLLVKFKLLQDPPIELLAACFEVCTALIPLFEGEIYKRIINLNILPCIQNYTLTHEEYAKGVSFDSGLVGLYLVNHETTLGKYKFLQTYLNFLKSYTDLYKDNVFAIEFPGLIFLLREIFPHVHTWRFETESERHNIYIATMQYFFDILQLSPELLKNDKNRKLLRDTCIYSLLNLENGMTLLRFVGIGNPHLQSVMENEKNWRVAINGGLNVIVQLSMTILMQILRQKTNVIGKPTALSPLETIIYTQPKQRDTFRIIPVVTSYMNNIFNRRLPILSCRLLRRFAIEFQMSLFACLDMEADQIRIMFLQRLRDNLESDNLKIAVLEFVEACIDKQPTLLEAFFNVRYKKDEKLDRGKQRNIAEGIPIYMEEYLEAISKEPNKIASPLLSRIMSLFHAIWRNNKQSLVKDLIEAPNFWSSLCNPLFVKPNPDIRAYSQLLNILGIELFKSSNGQISNDLKKYVIKFLSPEIFETWIKFIFNLPTTGESYPKGETPEWLSRLQSFKDFLIVVLKRKKKSNLNDIELPIKSKQILAKNCMKMLVAKSEIVEDFRLFIILAELYLIVLLSCNNKYTDNEKEDLELLKDINQLINCISISYTEIHVRARESVLGITIQIISFLPHEIMNNFEISKNIIRSVVDIICRELFEIDKYLSKPSDGVGVVPLSGREQYPIILSLTLFRKIVLIFDSSENSVHNWYNSLMQYKLLNRIMSLLNKICQIYNKRRVTAELLDLLIILANSDCSKELLFCEIGDYLWLKLLPPQELLKGPFNAAIGTTKWETQDWWPIYSKGIELVTTLLQKHRYHFLKDTINFIGIHEEYLIDSIMLAKESLEKNALMLIKRTLELICQAVNYHKQWRLEHGQSMVNLMRCIQTLMDHAISLLYRPDLLKHLLEGITANQLLDRTMKGSSSEDITSAKNELIEIIILCSKCLLVFSPSLVELICEPQFLPCQWQALIEIQFGPPKLNETVPQLSFGTILSAVSIFTKALKLIHYNFNETPLNTMTDKANETTIEATMPTIATEQPSFISSSPRPFLSKSMSSNYGGPTTPTNENLSNLDSKLCFTALEFILTLLASQSFLALKDTNLSNREKQLIKRELSNELLMFHEFLKKRLPDGRENLHRKKYGIIEIINKSTDGGDDDNDDEQSDDSEIVNRGEVLKTSGTVLKPTDYRNSMRVKLIKKMHLQQKIQPGKSPFDMRNPAIQGSTPIKDTVSNRPTSTPIADALNPLRGFSGSTIKRGVSDSYGHGKRNCQEDDLEFFEPNDPKSTVYYVKMVEEDYLHFLSNLFLNICHTDN